MGSLQVDGCTDVENEGFCFSQSDGEISERYDETGIILFNLQPINACIILFNIH